MGEWREGSHQFDTKTHYCLRCGLPLLKAVESRPSFCYAGDNVVAISHLVRGKFLQMLAGQIAGTPPSHRPTERALREDALVVNYDPAAFINERMAALLAEPRPTHIMVGDYQFASFRVYDEHGGKDRRRIKRELRKAWEYVKKQRAGSRGR